MEKKFFVVSDIHGYASLLKKELEKAGYDENNSRHLLICCGDYFDRGNENVEVMKYFERIENKVLLRGNHEDMLLKLFYDGKVLSHHLINGTVTTLENFLGKYSIDPLDNTIDFSGKNRIVDRLCGFIENTVDYYETKNYVFVHGWIPDGGETAEGRKKASKEEWEKARWKKWTEYYKGQPPIKDKTLVCGHMPTFYADRVDPSWEKNSASIFRGNGVIAIDGGTNDSGKINVLVLSDFL